MVHDAECWLLLFDEEFFCILADSVVSALGQRSFSSTPSGEWMTLRVFLLSTMTSRVDSPSSCSVAAEAFTTAGGAGFPYFFPLMIDVPFPTVGSSTTCTSKGSTSHVRRFAVALLFHFLPFLMFRNVLQPSSRTPWPQSMRLRAVMVESRRMSQDTFALVDPICSWMVILTSNCCDGDWERVDDDGAAAIAFRDGAGAVGSVC